MSSQKLGKMITVLFFLSLALVSCKDSSTDSESEDELVNRTEGLFLSLTNNSNGLYLLDIRTGEAKRQGEGHTAVEENGAGLASLGSFSPLIGANGFALHQIARDGSSASLIGNPIGQAYTEGLAYDFSLDVLYASSNGFLHIRLATTGETIETVLVPPNQPDIEGLAFDSDTRTLYGLARGFESHPEDRRGLFILDVNKPQGEWTWNEVGDTGGLWMDAGLAFNASIGMLFAVGRADDPGSLYLINPETANATRIGSTGLPSAAGGLAWISDETGIKKTSTNIHP